MTSRAVQSSAALPLLAAALVACSATPPAPAPQPSPAAPSPTAAPTAAFPSSQRPCPPDPPDPEPSSPLREADLTRTVPDRPVAFGRVLCKAGAEVWRDPQGRLRACTVARATALEGIDIAADAYSLFHEDGSPWQTTLAHAQRLQTGAGQEIPCAADLVVLTTSGVLELCTLEKPLVIGAVACRGGETVAFHDRGQLAGAVLDRPLAALGATFPAGTRLSWREGGAVVGGWLREPLSIGAYRIRYEFKVHPGGALAEIELAEPRTIQGHDFPEPSKLSFREDGSLRRAEYVTRRGLMPHGEPWTDTLHQRFDCAGKVVSSRVEHWQADTAPHPHRP